MKKIGLTSLALAALFLVMPVAASAQGGGNWCRWCFHNSGCGNILTGYSGCHDIAGELPGVCNVSGECALALAPLRMDGSILGDELIEGLDTYVASAEESDGFGAIDDVSRHCSGAVLRRHYTAEKAAKLRQSASTLTL